MSRIVTPATIADAPEMARPLLEAVKKQLGVAPNLYRLVATSPATLEGLLGLHGSLGKGKLPVATRERIALAVAQANGCDYCLSAHSYISANLLKLDAAEIAANREGRSADAKVSAALSFALALVEAHGAVSEVAIAAVRAAGHDDAEILEIIGHVALNIFTNYVNIALETEIDFPTIRALAA